jgi:hypothetical protein
LQRHAFFQGNADAEQITLGMQALSGDFAGYERAIEHYQAVCVCAVQDDSAFDRLSTTSISQNFLESGRKAFGSYFASADLPRLSDQAG